MTASQSAVEVSEHIAASPDQVYALISDMQQMGRWSPETTSCRWLGEATGPRVGACFRGRNRLGFRRWSTKGTVTAANPGRRFAFAISTGPVAVADWAYDFVDEADGCRVTESWVDRRPGWMRWVSGPVLGVSDRATHNEKGMRQTLSALKAAAENAVARG